MNITELDSYRLGDAVKFHNRLNPKLWGPGEHLLPDVRSKLMEIAADFQEFLGVSDLDVEDITISGSNAAFSYTPHSDIDLHLVVRKPQSHDEVYQELFNAKKYQYNDMHDIRIHGADVELYVQDADETPVSLGEYSVKNGTWIQVPKKKRAQIDQSIVKHKYEDLKARIESALKEDSAERIAALIAKIKTMRQTGLDQHGEFGPENLAFKILRKQGLIKQLYDAQAAARDRELSLQERNRPKARVRYGFTEVDTGMAQGSAIGDSGAQSTWDGVSPDTDQTLTEDTSENIVQEFIASTAQRLGIKSMPKVELHRDADWSKNEHSFGMYEPDSHTLHVNMANRHLMDILRTTAHELAHCRQHEISPLPVHAGKTGSKWENQAHAMAGVIMRDYADAHPELFEKDAVAESSGYIPTARQKNDPRFKMALSVDVQPGATGLNANRMSLKTDSQGRPQQARTNGLVESLARELEQFDKTTALFEIKMTGKNLRAEAARTGAQAGMEFEMIVPNTETDVEPEYEPDMDQDQRARSFSDIRDFFHDGDYNGRRQVDNLMEELTNEYEDWMQEQTAEQWGRDGVDYIRDYIEVNDLFDRSEALDQARDEVMDANPDLSPDSEDFQQLINTRINELQEQFVLESFEDQGRIYNDAFETFADEQREEYDERSFLDDRYQTMSDIQSNFDISWPYYYDVNEDSEGMDGQVVADEFSSYMNKPVNYSSSYHGGRREAGTYVVEPDGSLEGDNPGDGGLEFVSPPMPIDEMISDLNKVKAWADKTGCYTNDSTGLHINISVPNYSLDKLDYVKLALLMGDEYILELFGRSGNTYAKSAMSKIKTALKQKPEASAQIMDLMKQGLDGAATKAIHTGITDKYTSINTKNGYIEFRSPGGDWLDSNFAKIENTLLRFTVALSAAINPEAYRKEYLTKLYKLLSEGMDKSDTDVIQLFSNYSAGELDKAALIRQVRQKQLARNVEKGTVPGKKYWWDVQWDSNRRIEVVATDKAQAREAAAKEWRVPVEQLAIAKVTVLRPYEAPLPQTGNWGLWANVPQRFAAMSTSPGAELRRFETEQQGQDWLASQTGLSPERFDIREIPTDYQRSTEPAAAAAVSAANQGNWGIWMTSADRFARQPGQIDNNVLRRFPSREAAEQFIAQTRAENPNMRTDIEVREIPAEPSVPQGSSTGNWGVWVPSLNRFATIANAGPRRFESETDAQAWIQDYNTRNSGNDLELVAREVAPPGNRNTLMPTGPGPWEVFRISDGSSVAELGQTNRLGAEVEARRVIDQRREAPELYGVRTQQSNAAQPQFQEPSSDRGDLTPRGPGPWEIYRLADDASIRNLAHTNRQAAESEARAALGLRGGAPELYAVRTRQSDAAQGGVVDVAGEQPTAPRTLTTPGQQQQQWTGAWLVLDPEGRVLQRFTGIGNVQADANRHAMNWLRAHPGAMQAGVTVAPEMS